MTGVDPLPASEPLAGLRILIVEDEAMIALLIQDVLEEIGSVVIGPASRIPAALDLIAAEAIDLAVLDLNLAGQSVYPVAEVLAERGIPFVFITGYGQVSIDERWRNRPSLPKPFRPTQLAHSLRSALAAKG
jgi:CheY-like chemotaxis protein